MSNNLLGCFFPPVTWWIFRTDPFIWLYLPASISRPGIICFSLPSSLPTLSFPLLSLPSPLHLYFPIGPEIQAFGIPKECFLHPTSFTLTLFPPLPSWGIWKRKVYSCFLYFNSRFWLLHPVFTATTLASATHAGAQLSGLSLLPSASRHSWQLPSI